ncbi:MAG: glutamate 5-kinase [Clostridia bacterium]|nr:glutamate 5-kinase [Clostridia bacterium]
MRIVIKVGTSSLTHESGNPNIRHMGALVRVLSDIRNASHEVILVSSGAIAMGVGKLKLQERPKDTPTKQAAAAVGQCELMYFYDKQFQEYSHIAAQVLLTADDFESEYKRNNLKNTFEKLLQLGTIPVVNENDTLATAEITVGDNDTLAAYVACAVKADLLILLSDIDGLYSSDPHKDPDAKLISRVEDITPQIESLAGGAGSARGTGGMATKIAAAKLATAAGCDMVIANGREPELLYDIIAGEDVGTRFVSPARKQKD